MERASGKRRRGARPVLPALEPETWASRSVREHALGVQAACRAAMQILAGVTARDREARLRRIDPIPESSRRLLRRLAARDG